MNIGALDTAFHRRMYVFLMQDFDREIRHANLDAPSLAGRCDSTQDNRLRFFRGSAGIKIGLAFLEIYGTMSWRRNS